MVIDADKRQRSAFQNDLTSVINPSPDSVSAGEILCHDIIKGIHLALIPSKEGFGKVKQSLFVRSIHLIEGGNIPHRYIIVGMQGRNVFALLIHQTQDGILSRVDIK
jgi:hypothetical protein